MAALILSAAGGFVGQVFGPVGALAGRIAGALAGSMIDQALIGGGDRAAIGPRLSDLNVMGSTEGAPMPRVYGRARLSGQVIWAKPFEEVVSVTTTEAGGDGGKGFGGGPTVTSTTYSYFASFAVALCEGPISHVGRIWADGKPLDQTRVNIRVHSGHADQTPDELIIASEGAGRAPAYRDTAYVVLERLPLANFGNRIPQLTFEIIRPVGELEKMVRAVTLIPGSTEFGYEPGTVVRVFGPGQFGVENRHIASSPSDVIASLDELQLLCPNLQRVAVVVAWFGSDLRAGHCTVRAGVDNAIKATSPYEWSVAGLLRPMAHQVSYADGRPAYGGTPSDASVIHLIKELRARGLSVTLYPFVMMDIPAGNTLPDPYGGAAQQPYPWRGRITCHPAPGRPGSPQGTGAAAAQVDAFFANGYRHMVLHYANLAQQAGGVSAFVIGSEMKALTRVRSGDGIYPAVTQLAALAAEVKAILGGTIVTYAADWTEYGADVVTPDASEVRFPLDALWASPAIDVVGIDYYAPLADWRDGADHLDRGLAESVYDRGYLRANINGGEGYDWYYADQAARDSQHRAAITDGGGKPWMFRAKDLRNWWAQAHHERVAGVERASPTGWIPQSKPIWLTEVGCPAVEKGANQPSVFPDPKSSEGQAPHYSNGRRDDMMQRRFLEAVLSNFDPDFGADAISNPVSSVYGGRMVDPAAIHLWTWDARPFPIFPGASDVWGDVSNWTCGHWLTGRLGNAPLDALVGAILTDAGVADVDTMSLTESCDGYVVDQPMATRAMIEPLALAYGFNATVEGGRLRFIQRGGGVTRELDEDDLVLPDRGAPYRLTRAQESELPQQAGFSYTDPLQDYRRAAVTSRKLVGGASRMRHAELSVISHAGDLTRRAEIALQDAWAGREQASFTLGMGELAISPGDVVAVRLNERRRLFEVSAVDDTGVRSITARSIDPEVFATPMIAPTYVALPSPPPQGPVAVAVLDLPNYDGSSPSILTRLAVFADPWPGPVAIWRSLDGGSFSVAAVAEAPTLLGETLDALPIGPCSRWDYGNALTVRLYGGALASQSPTRVLDGANALAVQTARGDWEIIQFVHAELIANRTYRLTQLLRGQGGAEFAMTDVIPAAARVAVLGPHLVAIGRGPSDLGRPAQLRIGAAAAGHGDSATSELTVTPGDVALRPLSPVHLRARRVDGDVLITWIRRTRVDGDSWAVTDVPLGEVSEAYRVEILSGDAVLRSFTPHTPSQIYSNAEQIADFGNHPASLQIRVAQLSDLVGPGAATLATLTL